MYKAWDPRKMYSTNVHNAGLKKCFLVLWRLISYNNPMSMMIIPGFLKSQMQSETPWMQIPEDQLQVHRLQQPSYTTDSLVIGPTSLFPWHVPFCVKPTPSLFLCPKSGPILTLLIFWLIRWYHHSYELKICFVPLSCFLEMVEERKLACCSPWGHKESDVTEQCNWATEQQPLSRTFTPLTSIEGQLHFLWLSSIILNHLSSFEHLALLHKNHSQSHKILGINLGRREMIMLTF